MPDRFFCVRVLHVLKHAVRRNRRNRSVGVCVLSATNSMYHFGLGGWREGVGASWQPPSMPGQTPPTFDLSAFSLEHLGREKETQRYATQSDDVLAMATRMASARQAEPPYP